MIEPLIGLQNDIPGIKNPVFSVKGQLYSLQSTVYSLQSTVYSHAVKQATVNRQQPTVFSLESSSLTRLDAALQQLVELLAPGADGDDVLPLPRVLTRLRVCTRVYRCTGVGVWGCMWVYAGVCGCM